MSRLWVALLVMVVATAQGAALDDDLLAAREAFRVGDTARLDQHAASLKGHLLEPYVAYWQLSLRLEQAPAEDVRAFLAAQRDGPLAEPLRNDSETQVSLCRPSTSFPTCASAACTAAIWISTSTP